MWNLNFERRGAGSAHCLLRIAIADVLRLNMTLSDAPDSVAEKKKVPEILNSVARSVPGASGSSGTPVIPITDIEFSTETFDGQMLKASKLPIIKVETMHSQCNIHLPVFLRLWIQFGL